jgi:hypothetical protein
MNIDYLKSINIIYINYTTKIKIENDLINLLERGYNPKYNNIIFYINLNELTNNLRKIIKKSLDFTPNNDNILIYFNKDNYVYYNVNYTIPINKIDEFLNMNDKYYNCDVCFKNNLDFVNGCHKCDFKICNECIITSIKTKDRTKGRKNVDCLICGYNNGFLYVE